MPQSIERAPAGATHELKELEVYVVSMVDRPANKRDFLVVKRNNMPVGQELHDDGTGGLTPSTSTTKEFGDAAKKKLKSALTSVSGKLTKLIDSIDGSSDEVASMKAAAGIGASLSKFAPKDESTEKSADESTEKSADDASQNATDAPASDPLPTVRAPSTEAIKALAARTAKSDEQAQALQIRKREERDARVDKHLRALTQAAHTLTSIAARKNSGGTRLAPAAKSVGETHELPSEPVWRSDMNSAGIPPDEQFV